MRRPTVRVRLTALYTGLFLATAAVLLVTTNLLLNAQLQARLGPIGKLIADPPTPPPGPPPPGASPESMNVKARAIRELPDAVVGYQWTISILTIAVLAIVSVALGWWLAGRFLRPLHRITATATRLSLSNLHERIALTGPQDELTELADTFDSMLDRLLAAAESQRQFIANASHELRTPLAIQRAAIEIGLDKPTSERLEQVRADLLEVNRRNERLIDGLLILAQGENGLRATEPVALDAVARQAVSEIPAGGVDVRLDTEPATVTGDPVLLHRLVVNLVHNAVRYNTPGGSVDVRVAAGVMTVRNTGPEVPADRVGDLFEPFRRLHTARTGSAESAGLGLSIVASIARAHDAELTAEPNPGGGLEISVRFGFSRGSSRAEVAGACSGGSP